MPINEIDESFQEYVANMPYRSHSDVESEGQRLLHSFIGSDCFTENNPKPSDFINESDR